jgi:hypothetical protein
VNGARKFEPGEWVAGAVAEDCGAVSLEEVGAASIDAVAGPGDRTRLAGLSFQVLRPGRAARLAGGGLDSVTPGDGHKLLVKEMAVSAHAVEFKAGAVHTGKMAAFCAQQFILAA